MQKNRAFTLIELLVVIAIIAILAAILFPVFAQAKMAAKKTKQIAQVKQINTANQIYMADYDDVIVPAYNGSGLPFHLILYPYMKSYDILISGVTAPNSAATNQQNGWDYIWAIGTLPMARLYQLPHWTVSDFPISRALGVVGARYDGVMGWAVPSLDPRWGNYPATDGQANFPSKSNSQLESPSEAAILFDSQDPFAGHVTWGAAEARSVGACTPMPAYHPGGQTIVGAVPRWGGPQSCAGWGASASIPEATARKVLDGTTVVSFVDTSTRAVGLSRLYRTVECPSAPGFRCMVHFPVTN